MKKLSIIIPAYNEERSISQILGKIHQTRLIGETEKEILIIDDGSKDSTAEKCRQFMQAHPDLDIHYHLQPFNQGKGAALRTGIALATGDWIIIQDADLEYDPEDYNPLLQWVIENNAKVVYGSRFLKPSNKHSYLRFYLGGRLVTFVTNLLYSQHLTVCKKGIKIHEIPINYYPRSIAEGKKINWKDGLEAIWTLLKYRFKN